MDFTLGLVTGMYAVVAVIVFYVVYVIEVKLGMAKTTLTLYSTSHTLLLSSPFTHSLSSPLLEVTEFSLFIVSIFANQALCGHILGLNKLSVPLTPAFRSASHRQWPFEWLWK